MASDSRADDAATSCVRQAVGPLVSGLSKAIFGVCAVAVGALALLLAVGNNTTESGIVFLVLGVGALLIGFVTISRLPKPDTESTSGTEPTTASQDGDSRRNAD